MYEWIEALGYEVEAAARRAAGSRRESLSDAYDRGLAQLSGTVAGERLGQWVRSFGGAVSQVPILSWQADLVTARHGVDHLLGQVKQLPAEDPQAGLVTVQLVEALDDVRRERLAMRAATSLVNPVGTAVSVALVTAGQLSGADSARLRLIRRAHAIAARRCRTDPTFVDLHVLARAYLAAGKPHHAARFAVDAAHLARGAQGQAAPAPASSSVFSRLRNGARDGIGGAVGVARQVAGEAVAPTYEQLAPAEQWRRRCGAALVTAAWAHLTLNELDKAAEAADAAVRLGNTMGYLPQAAALPATGLSAKQRLDRLRKVESRDRREYGGIARGDGGTAWHLTSLQANKAVRLVKRRNK